MIRFISIFILLISNLLVVADEGMWLPARLDSTVLAEMKARGLNLTYEEIFSNKKPALTDAIVQFGDFCTAEVVSSQGLLFTNHHCGYDAIAGLSSVSENFLDDGFWAMNSSEEIPVEGLSVSFVDRMVEVTKEVKQAENQDQKIQDIIDEAQTEDYLRAEVVDFFEGELYYLIVYKQFNDIRLVGTPPAFIGKFGGDTDNWMWPRHTGDFSMFRIYAGPGNKPSEYNEANKPYKPQHHLPVSIKGYEQGDYTMILGFPGNTERYIPSYTIKNYLEVQYPANVKLMGSKLKIMKEAMDKDEQVKLDMASDYASLSNSHKYYKGVIENSEKTNILELKRQKEAEFASRIEKDDSLEAQYGDILTSFDSLYKNSGKYGLLASYLNFAAFSPQFIERGVLYYRILLAVQETPEFTLSETQIEEFKNSLDSYHKSYQKDFDEKQIAMALERMDKDLPDEFKPDLFESELFTDLKAKKNKTKYEAFAELISKKSFLANRKKEEKLLDKFSGKKLAEDPAMVYVTSVIDLYRNFALQIEITNAVEANLMSGYIRATKEVFQGTYYPDANFTLRLTYGTVQPYTMDNGKKSAIMTNHEELLAKVVPEDEEFHIDQDYKSLLEGGDFKPYNEGDLLPVDFLSNTDISGGNSGSPVLDGDGNLIGITFDGNWESMSSDLYFNDELTRSINVDIRYVLFIIEKYGKAGHLIKEMTVVK